MAILISFVAGEQSPESLISNFENKLQGIKSLEADFVQVYLPAGETRGLEEKGRLYLLKPDRMRWDYFSPEKKTFLLQKDLLLSAFPEDKQLIRQALQESELKETIMGLLAGQAKLSDLYQVAVLGSLSDKKTLTLRLEPSGESEISQVILEVDRERWVIQKVSFLETTGNRQEFRFSRVKINPSLPERLFELTVPADWEIIQEKSALKRNELLSDPEGKNFWLSFSYYKQVGSANG